MMEPSINKKEGKTMSENMPYYVHKDLQILCTADFVVVGGGPSGCAAAITAARKGLRVVLVERYGFAGGAAVSQLVPVMLSQNGKDFPPIWHDWVREMQSLGGVREMIRGEQRSHWFCATSSPEAEKIAWDKMFRKSGVRVLFHAEVIDVIVQQDLIKALVVSTRNGEYAITGKTFADCTGDGMISFLAGEDYMIGNGVDPVSQASTKMFRLLHAVKPELHLTPQNTQELINNYHASMEKKEFTDPVITSGYLLKYVLSGAGKQLPDTTLLINAARLVNVNPLDPWDLSSAESNGRQSAVECAQFMKKYVPGSEHSLLLDTSIEVGVRASRRIKCRYELSIVDVLSLKDFEDGIALGSWEIDIHAPMSFEYGEALKHSDSLNTYRKSVISGKCYTIPFRCLVPQKTRNLLVAGRSICCDYQAQGTIRIQQTCMSTGTAAGIAAVMAYTEQSDVCSVDGNKVSSVIKEMRKRIQPAFPILRTVE